MSKQFPKKTVVLGASANPSRYSYLAVKMLREKGHEVAAIGLRPGKIDDVEILKGRPQLENVHTITLYMRPQVQKDLYDYMLSLNPKRIIFNPGTENWELEEKADAAGVETVTGCTLVMLSIGNY